MISFNSFFLNLAGKFVNSYHCVRVVVMCTCEIQVCPTQVID